MRTFRYRKHIRWLKLALPLALIGMIVWLLGSIPFSRWDTFMILITAVLAAEAIGIWIIFDRMAAVELSLGENGIVYRSKKRLIEIPYDQIKEFRYPSIRYIGGWIKIISESETIRLTVVVEGIGTFIRDLKAELDRRDLSSTYQKKKLFRFYKTAEYSDQSWERSGELFWRIVLLLPLCLPVGAFVGYRLGGERWGMFGTLFWLLCGVVPALLIYVIAEMVLARRLAKGSDEETFQALARDRAVERRVFRRALMIGAAVYLLAIILVL